MKNKIATIKFFESSAGNNLPASQELIFKAISQKINDKACFSMDEIVDMWLTTKPNLTIYWDVTTQDMTTGKRETVTREYILDRKEMQIRAKQWLAYNLGRLLVKGFLRVSTI